MAGKKYTIDLNVKTTQAEAATNRVGAAFRAMEDGALQSAKAAERATERAAVSAQKLADLKASIEMRAADRSVAATERAAERKAIAEERAAQRGAVAGERAIAAHEQQNARRERGAVQLYTKEEALARAKTEAIRRENDKLVSKELELMGVTGRRFANGWEGSQKLIDSTVNLAMSYVGLQAGLNIVQSIGQAQREAAESQERMTNAYIAYRRAQGEQLDMRGMKISKENVLAAARMEAETGMRADEAQAFTSGFAGSGEQHKGRTLSAEHFEEFRLGAAKLAMATKIGPGVMGEFAGTMAGSRDYEKEHGKDAGRAALADLNKGIAILQRGKGNNTQLAQNTSALASFMANPDEALGTFNNVKEYATAVSVASEFNPGEAAIYAKNAAEAIHPKDNSKAAPLMQRAGVTESTKFYDAYAKLAPVVLAEAREKKIDVNTLLRNHYGYGKQQAVAMGAFIQKGVGDKPEEGVIADRFDYGEQMGTVAATEAKIRESETNVEGSTVHDKSEARKRLEELRRGQETSPVKTLQVQAEAAMTAPERREETNGIADNIWNFTVGGVEQAFGLMPSLEQRKHHEMEAILQKRAKTQGIKLAPKVATRYGGQVDAGNSLGYEAHEDYFKGRAKEFEAQGGNPLVDLTREMVELNRKQLEAAQRAAQPRPQQVGVGAGMRR